MLGHDSSIDELLKRTNRFSVQQVSELCAFLEGVTVAQLLKYQTAQELADTIEEKARERYKVVSQEWSEREMISADQYLEVRASIKLSDMGNVAWRLLDYVHQMFDPIPGAIPQPSF